MNELLKSEQNTENLILPLRCPICGVETNYVYRIEEGLTHEKAQWYKCQCGVIFQETYPKHGVYNKDYFLDFYDMKESKVRITHAAHTYVNLIEELTYGRMMLDVGFLAPNTMEFFKNRGWLTWGIDVNEIIEGGGSIYKGDFLEYDFSPKIDKEKLKEITGETEVKRTFDLIWMSHVLEHFNDPLRAINKAYNLLSDTGILYIAVPDIEFIYKTGVAGWSHFKKREHYIMWSEGALRRELERLGFKVIMMRRNFSSRFSSWYDIHCICQRNYF